MGTTLGVFAVIVSNVIAVNVVVPLPPEGVLLRLQHHFFDALELGALGLWLAAPLWAYGRRPRSKRALDIGWVLYGLLCCAAMYGILHVNLHRQATAVLDGKVFYLLYPLYIVMCGFAVPAGYFLGGFLWRLSRAVASRWVGHIIFGFGVVISLAAIVVSHVILPDDYPGVHAAMFWVAACVLGATVATPVVARVSQWSQRARHGWLFAFGVVAVAGAIWSPPNRVRKEMFRQAGGVAPWVLSQVLWRMPSVDAEVDTAFTPRKLDDDSWARARRGIPADLVVVMLTIDALRGDVVNDKANDKSLKKLAYLRDHGANFERASAPGSQTSVSLTSMFSGRYYSQLYWSHHGEGKKRFLYAADDPTHRFPKLLTDAGVATHSVVGLIFLQDRFGIGRGFADEKIVVKDRSHGRASQIMTPLLSKLKNHKDGPAFFYAHLMEPHEPYNRGKLKTGSDWDRYLSEIAIVDAWLGRLMRDMRKHHKRRGIIIISADHGEAFGEHGTKFHTKTLYDELLHVPLIVWGAAIPKRTISERVGLIDIAPTILHMYGLDPEPGHVGESLLPRMRLDDNAEKRFVMAEGRLRRALYTHDGIKVIEDTVRKVVEAYDVNEDPKELVNIFDAGDPRVDRGVAELRRWFETNTLRKDGYQPPYKP